MPGHTEEGTFHTKRRIFSARRSSRNEYAYGAIDTPKTRARVTFDLLARWMMLVFGRRLGVSLLQLRLLSSLGSENCESGSEMRFAERGESEGKGKTVKLTVSSLRIDAVAAAGLGLSRQCVIISSSMQMHY